MLNEGIRSLCYELYKLDWLHRNVSSEIQMDTLKNWYQETEPGDRKEYTFEDYIDDQGYFGTLYVCFDEFLGAEYLDKEYIKGLLSNDGLFSEYLQDMTDEVITVQRDGDLLKIIFKVNDEYVGYARKIPDALMGETFTGENVEDLLSKSDEYFVVEDFVSGDYQTVVIGLGICEATAADESKSGKEASETVTAATNPYADAAVDEGYLSDWFINSVGTEEPVWTDDHIDELCHDFYIIPKEGGKKA